MSTAVCPPTATAKPADARGSLLSRAGDFLELTKPRIASLVLVTVAVGAAVASWGMPDPWIMLHAVFGTALVASSASAFNQILERDTDALMPRTAERPLVAGRLSVAEAATFGAICVLAGAAYLAVTLSLATAAVACLTWILYVMVYTPLKRVTPLNTVVGAIAGAMPVIIGWMAAGGGWNVSAAAAVLIVYLWQFPHFMAIAWLYRRQYHDAGLKMLPSVDMTGRRAARQAIVASLLLVPISVMPMFVLPGGASMMWWPLALSLAYVVAAMRFAWRIDDASARVLLRVSLIHLPSVLLALVAAPLW